VIDIQQRLRTLFETHRLIFWYDNDAALQDEFENIDIDGVERLTIDNNEFGIKRQVLRIQPEQKFLIYSPQPAPQDEANWLLDLNLANYMFSADKHSLTLQNLGLDVSFKSFIAQHEAFFNPKATKRIETLKTMLNEEEDTHSLAVKMMAVAIGGNDTIEEILLRVLEKRERFDKLTKLGLSALFFERLKQKFGYTGESLDDFIHKLLLNHFYHCTQQTQGALNSNARIFVSNWMDSSKYKEVFKRISKQVEHELNIGTLLSDTDTQRLLTCDTFEQCDKIVIADLLQRLYSERIDAKTMQEAIEKREHTFWFDAYANIYKAMLSASLLFDFIKQCDFTLDSFDEGIATYTSHWHKTDRYYRNYTLHSSRAEHIELLKRLNDKVEDIYLNGFLRNLGERWQPFVQAYSTQTQQRHQQHFYKEFVTPLLQKKQKVFVVISDALRYECGVELASHIASIDRYQTHCESMVSSLPSYTQLGMASLLPHKSLAIKEKNDTVYVDGKSSSGTANRDKILKSYDTHATAIGAEAFLQLNRDEGRTLAKESSVIYIYHDEIDKMGEKNESKTFDAVESAFTTLVKIVKQIANFNGSNIFITSDHGFLFTNRATAESEFCQVDSSGSIKLNRRFIIGKGLQENTCTSRFTGEQLGIEGENEYLIAKSINKIRMQGGGNRFVHGGAMLQEIVIPLITIKKKRSTDTKEVNVEIFPLRNISTNTVTVALYQADIANEKTKPVTLKIAFESKDGTQLSDSVTHTFDSTEQYDTNREVRFKLTFKKDIDSYNNQTIRLVTRKILPQSSETPVYKQIDVKLTLSIFNDFDDDF